jgi:hypothetical protein
MAGKDPASVSVVVVGGGFAGVACAKAQRWYCRLSAREASGEVSHGTVVARRRSAASIQRG